MAETKSLAPHTQYTKYPINRMRAQAQSFYEELKGRRTVRKSSNEDIPRDVIKDCLMAADTAPNRANMQPWHFIVVSDESVKKRLEQQKRKSVSL